MGCRLWDHTESDMTEVTQQQRQQQTFIWASQVVLVVRNPPANAGDIRDEGSISGSGRFPGEGNVNPLQYS